MDTLQSVETPPPRHLRNAIFKCKCNYEYHLEVKLNLFVKCEPSNLLNIKKVIHIAVHTIEMIIHIAVHC